ncbi:SDR family NAD(P)-dependent oxidoreductase [Cellulomonas hominis]|uniref:SDR family NAD(P)-dependent oxidoreductase n=1 Tax=Cellulomonas hominis TaxID=156981 RepID=A0A7Z8K398_9CELL|nr:SDR family NAD(P)-dependent oxidoreductase [Cellulomonas hominis]TKR27367.1 SDR family NAD(P)-dependent oxidoreductase [Cellulomonas hominis]
MPTIAIIGAGPGLGLAIARRFGSEGFDVALVARNPDKLDGLVADLAADGITAAAFPADVLDRDGLTAALDAAKRRFGGIDVLEYSPADASAGPLAPVHIRETTPENTQAQIEYYLYGAQAAAAAVLPDLRRAGAGTLLFTSGAGSITPTAVFGNVNAGAAAMRNWALNLAGELEGDGIHVAHLAIAAWITDQAPDGVPAMSAAEIAPFHWDAHQNRSAHEIVVAP